MSASTRSSAVGSGRLRRRPASAFFVTFGAARLGAPSRLLAAPDQLGPAALVGAQRSRPRSPASGGRPRRAARGRARRAARSRGTPRARPRAPRGSRGRGGSSARRARGSSRPTRRRARARAGAARRPRAPPPASRAPPSPRRGSGRAGTAPAAAGARSRPGRSRARVPALVQLDLVLREVRRLDAVAEPHRAGRGLAAAEQRLEQRRLARAVRADEGDVLAALERERDAVEQLLVAGRDARALRPRRRSGRSAPASGTRSRASAGSSSGARARPPGRLRSVSSRPMCVSFACACLALLFL